MFIHHNIFENYIFQSIIHNNSSNWPIYKRFFIIGFAGVAILDTIVTHLDETSHMSAESVFRYGPKCMGGLILPILVLLHL